LNHVPAESSKGGSLWSDNSKEHVVGLHDDKTDDELIAAMRGKAAKSLDYIELDAELQRRVASRQLDAGTAQIRSARYQFWAVVAMFLTTAFTAWVTWVAAGR
jgi:hypothetical protein